MIDLSAYIRAFGRLPAEVVEAEVNAEAHRLCLVRLYDGRLIGEDLSEGQALYLRVSGRRTGYYYTQDLADEPEKALLKAYGNGEYSESALPDEMRRDAEALRLDFGGKEAESDLGVLEKFAADFGAELQALLPKTAELGVELRAETICLRTINSHGLDVGSVRPLYVLNATASAERKGRRHVASYNRTASDPEAFSAEEFGRNLAELLEGQYDPMPLRSGLYPLLLRNNVVYNLMSTAWQLFSGVKHAERSSMLAGHLGEQVASPCLSLVDYPSRPGSGFDIPCDCEGSPGKPVHLMEDGILKGLMHNLTTAKALGAGPTGNAGRRPLLSGSIPTAIQVTPRNFCVEPGASTPTELIKTMGEGVILTESFDVFHSLNIASGAFSVPCRGVRVQGGKRGSATGPLVLTGDLGDLFRRIAEVGNDFYIGTMLALDNYGIGTCSLLVDGLSLSGS